MRRQVLYVAGLMVALASMATPVFAGRVAAPEIDGSSLTIGLGLLTGSVMILRSRWAGKKRSR